MERSRVGFCFPKRWCGCGLSARWDGPGKVGGTFKGLEPEFSLPGTVNFSKTYLEQFYKRGPRASSRSKGQGSNCEWESISMTVIVGLVPPEG